MITPAPQAYQDSTENPLAMSDKRQDPILELVPEYMRRHVSDDQDWEQVDDEDCWGVDYTEPTSQIRGKIKTILHTWGEEQPGTEQAERIKLSPERERFSVPRAARDPKILKDRNLENEDIFELIKHIHRPHSGSDHTGHCHRLSTIGPSKHGWSIMAPLEAYPDERWP